MRKILISESMLCKIVSECVRRYLEESRGAIDARMGKLAELIWDTIQKGEYKFVIDTETINQYQDYFKATKPIEIEAFSDENKREKAELEIEANKYTLYINLKYVGVTLRPIPSIVHELTHLVNAEKYNVKTLYNFGDKTIDRWTYLYRDTERNARISEFGYYLDEKKKRGEDIGDDLNDDEYNNILKLKDMQEVLSTLYYGNKISGHDPVLYLFHTNQLVPLKDKTINNENYFRIKNNIYKWYYNKYANYLKKAIRLIKYYNSI